MADSRLFTLLALAGCTSAMWQGPSPFSQQETERALAPLPEIERSCYAGSLSEQKQHHVRVEIVAYIDAKGNVHADPVDADRRDPGLIACLQQRIDQLKFPAKGEADQLRLRVELAPTPAK